MGQEWNWQIDELKRQEEYNASQIKSAIDRQTNAINHAASQNSSKSSVDTSSSFSDLFAMFTVFIPEKVKTKIKNVVTNVAAFLITAVVVINSISLVIGLIFKLLCEIGVINM